MTLRKGQKLINHMREKYKHIDELIEVTITSNDGIRHFKTLDQDGHIRQAIFYMSDDEFDKVIGAET